MTILSTGAESRHDVIACARKELLAPHGPPGVKISGVSRAMRESENNSHQGMKNSGSLP